jgi:hypothetical protein
MLVRVDPPLAGKEYGVSGLAIDLVILAPHLTGDTLFPISRWPLRVYVVRSRAAALEKLGFLEDAPSDILAWGELYPTEDEARRAYYPPLQQPQSEWPKPGDYPTPDEPTQEAT